MTLTATGRRLQCDQAGCTKPGTVEHDAWTFCAEHAGSSQALVAPLAPRATVGQVARAVTAPPVAAPAAPSPSPSPIGVLLEQASGHSSAKVRRLAERIETQLAELREVIAATAKQEAARKAAEEERAKAKADVERLAAELAAAKAKLAPARKTTGGISKAPAPCEKCGGEITRPAGTAGRWAKQCTSCRANAA